MAYKPFLDIHGTNYWHDTYKNIKTQSPQLTIAQVISNSVFLLALSPITSLTPHYIRCVQCARVCVCVHLCGCFVREICTILWLCYYHFCGFIAYIIDLVKHCVLTLVGDIWHFRNDHIIIIIILATHYVPSLRQTVTISSLHMAAMSIPRKHNRQTHVQFVFHTCG